MAASFILADSPRVRFATGSIMYFAQGIPQGLLAIAIPACWPARASAPRISAHISPSRRQYLPNFVVGPINRDIDAATEIWSSSAGFDKVLHRGALTAVRPDEDGRRESSKVSVRSPILALRVANNQANNLGFATHYPRASAD